MCVSESGVPRLCREESLKGRCVAPLPPPPSPFPPCSPATPKRGSGSPYPKLKGPRQNVGVRIPNSRGHTKAWESVSPTQGATPKHGNPYTPTRRATPKRGSPYPQLEGPHQRVGKSDRKTKETTQYRRSPLKEFGAALGLGLCSECTIVTLQQTTCVQRPVLLILALRNKQHLYSASSC